MRQGDVALYDLPDDGDSHRVGFSCRDDDHPPYTGENRVSASFTADHSWTSNLVSVHGPPAAAVDRAIRTSVDGHSRPGDPP